ncbi:hypothetical protein C8R45DRAFT_1133094 [Mycena sanguinolenta]|nr:hypothetical protein C8R45DRAFT_1133094 [Mycena sanguinolenta]
MSIKCSPTRPRPRRRLESMEDENDDRKAIMQRRPTECVKRELLRLWPALRDETRHACRSVIFIGPLSSGSLVLVGSPSNIVPPRRRRGRRATPATTSTCCTRVHTPSSAQEGGVDTEALVNLRMNSTELRAHIGKAMGSAGVRYRCHVDLLPLTTGRTTRVLSQGQDAYDGRKQVEEVLNGMDGGRAGVYRGRHLRRTRAEVCWVHWAGSRARALGRDSPSSATYSPFALCPDSTPQQHPSCSFVAILPPVPRPHRLSRGL